MSDLPTGREHGQFLALDLGGTNFRYRIVREGVNKTRLLADMSPIRGVDPPPAMEREKKITLKGLRGGGVRAYGTCPLKSRFFS